MMKHGVKNLTTDRIHMGTQQEVSLHQRNTAEDETGMIEICIMSSAAEMQAIASKISVRSPSAFNRRSMKKGTTTTMVPTMTNLTDSILPKGGQMQEESSLFLMT
jgi:hypothetical protein